MVRTIIDASAWEEKLQELLLKTEINGASMRYEALGVRLVATGCQLEANERMIYLAPSPSGQPYWGDSVLEVVRPDPDHPLTSYRCFEDEKGGLYLSFRHALCGIRPEPFAELEIATSSELLNPEVNSPLIH
jgi:hypothetical protein